MRSKAQITLFIIAGIIVLLVVGLVFMLINRTTDTDVDVIDPEMVHVTGFVAGCLDEAAKPGVKLLGAQGGHIILPDDYVSAVQLDVAYGYYNGNMTLAGREEMEREIAGYVDAALLQCVGNFSDFPGKDISFELPDTEAEIAEQKIMLRTDFPVEIDGRIVRKFSTEVPIALGRIHDVAVDVIENIETDPGWIDLSYLSRFEGVKVNMVPHSEDTLLYFLLDDRDYLFIFASKFQLNRDPVLNMADEFELPDGEPWLYKAECVDPDNDPVVVEDDTAMLETLEDGSILSTPEIPGEYNVTFTCSDDHYNRAEKTVLIRVLE